MSGRLAKTFQSIVFEIGLILLSIALFYLAFPNDINVWGFGFLGFVALFPLMRLIHRASFLRLVLYGPFIGFGTYAAFNIWLTNFHPLAIFIVPTIYAGFFFVLIPLLKLPCLCMGRFAWIGQVFIWLAFEYLRTTGFLSYAYGIIGYTQYLNIPLVNLASLTSIWGVSAIVLLPQFFLAQSLSAGQARGALSAGLKGFWADVLAQRSNGERSSALQAQGRKILRAMQSFGSKYRAECAVISILILASYMYGWLSQVDYSSAPQVKMALVQQNVDPWIGGTRAYRNSMEASIRQTQLALEEAPDTELVVWSETSFVPSIDYHSRYRQNPERYELVQELLAYIESTGKPVLLGNGDGQLVVNEQGERVRQNYNAVYLYANEQERQIYRKKHLVPFTEYFPYRQQLPWLYQVLLDRDTSFWEHGDEWTVFELGGLGSVERLRFSTPICFEDTFSYLTRGFVQRGAEVIINLTNDSWSKSVPSATQHAAMAVFRSAETRRSLVRSTNGGLTIVIDPNGRIIAENAPFTESYIIANVPVYTASNAPALFVGDAFAYIFTALGSIVVLASLALIARARLERAGRKARRAGRGT